MLALTLSLLALPLAVLAGTPTIGLQPTSVLEARQSHPETVLPCQIINANNLVNCHDGPYLSSPVVRTLEVGAYYRFNCYDRGDCYEDNWFVHILLLLEIIFIRV